ncbi:hypothetical protein MPER_11412 [Moniliophthora perniciosa FA553]|nr:hypothetical protein MPER_11412 [Moniliophthora perniciosa FA553]
MTIRHPARVLPSFVRATSPNLSDAQQGSYLFRVEKAARFRWERLVFDSFNRVEHGPRPLVVDGDRLVQDPQEQMRMLCERLGIDTYGTIKYNWDPAVVQEIYSDCPKGFKEDFFKSSGVIANKKLDEPVLIENERHRWAEEWGEELAFQMEGLVCEAMEDYEYLRQFAI